MILILIGISSGAIFSSVLSDTDKSMVSSYLNNFFSGVENNSFITGSSFLNTLIFSVGFGLLIWLFGLSVIGVLFILPFLFIKSFVLGFSLGSMDVVFYSALAFGVGTFIDFKSLTKLKLVSKCVVVLLHIVTGVVLILLNKIEVPFVKEIMILFGICSSIMFISMLQGFKPIARFLDFVNKYSFQIYLLHTIFTAGIRIILLRMNIGQWWIHVLLGTACGLVFSVLAAVISKKVKFLNFFFFPAKAYALKKELHRNSKSQ
jgi:hypothetical protein